MINPLMNAGVAAGALFPEIDLELFLGAAKLPLAVLMANGSREIEPEVGRSQEYVAKQQPAQMGKLANAGIDLKGTEESNGADDHHEILHLNGDQEREQDGSRRVEQRVGHQYAED